MDDFRFVRCGRTEFVFIHNRKIDFGEHCHSFDHVITCITDGKAFLNKNGTVQAVETGSIFSVKPYENHSLTSDKPLSLVSFCIGKELFGYERDIFIKEITSSLDRLRTCLPLSDELYNSFLDTAAGLYDKGQAENTDEQTVISSIESIESSPETEYSVDRYAEKAYLSKFHFIRRFRKAAGLTPHRFQIQNRIRKAQKLLNDGSKITDTAVRVGFFDQSHFDKYFKKIVGMTPKEYITSSSNFLQE